MTSIRRPGLFMGVLILLATSVCAAADFSADLYAGGKDQKTTQLPRKAGKIYVSGNKFRQEINYSPKQQMITITRLDKKLVWAVNPASKEYVEMPIRSLGMADPRSEAAFANQGTKKSLGTEKVEGYTCQKTEYVFNNAQGQKIVRWFSPKLNWPVKIQISLPGGQSATQEVRNVRVGKQSMSLFELPRGYKKAQMPARPPLTKPGGPGKPSR